jgi:hypothetical protein
MLLKSITAYFKDATRCLKFTEVFSAALYFLSAVLCDIKKVSLRVAE